MNGDKLKIQNKAKQRVGGRTANAEGGRRSKSARGAGGRGAQ